MSTERSPAKGLPSGSQGTDPGLPERRPTDPGEPAARKSPPPLPVEHRAGAGAAAPAVLPGEEEPQRRGLLLDAPSWLVSMIFHLVLMLLLTLLTQPPQAGSTVSELLASTTEDTALESLEPMADEPDRPIELAPPELLTAGPAKIDPGPMRVQSSEPAQLPAIDLSPLGTQAAGADLLAREGMLAGDALSGRGQAARSQLIGRYGGNQASEDAVAMALKWLVKHRMADGGWNFQLTAISECNGKCRNSGELRGTRIAATGLALLPFLGAGQTHREGEYSKVVREGIYYLIKQMQSGPLGGALNDPGGNMYSHGIASIALCEAYAMTGDKTLRSPAQQAANFICRVQDPIGGGWRYKPFQQGDTSVVGWQIMALKSALFGELAVPTAVLLKAAAFLDSVQMEDGAMYGYTFPSPGAATTAIGLLCRMHLGWTKDTPALRRGVEILAENGPSPGDMYYNYYATQVLHHWEGPEWKKWNERMRDQLVAAQVTKGHERGSWFMPDGDMGSRTGGRLYCTAMAAMILEVYYRHMPIYSKKSFSAEFPK